jgi:hypothetical protein
MVLPVSFVDQLNVNKSIDQFCWVCHIEIISVMDMDMKPASKMLCFNQEERVENIITDFKNYRGWS